MVRIATLLLVIGGLAVPRTAAADDIDFELIGRVIEAQDEPTLVLHINRAIVSLKLDLKRQDDKPIKVNTGTLKPGDTYRVTLKAPIGKSTFAGTLNVEYDGGEHAELQLQFEVEVVAELVLDIPDGRIDLEKNRLQLRMSRPAGRCEYEVMFDGADTDIGVAKYAGEAPGTWLTVPWRPCGVGCVVLKIRLFCYDTGEIRHGVELFPWWLEIPHEEVNFDSGSAVIRPSERPKLDRAYVEIAAAIRRYSKVISIKLYVAGHTDTVGDAALNQQLSLERARVLAKSLRKRGVTVPVFFTGYGEKHLAMETADEVDESRNRRARYILAVTSPVTGDWHDL